MSILEKLQEAVKTAEARGKIYGGAGREGHRLAGAAMAELFPNGLLLKDADDFTRFILFIMCMTKVSRYAMNINKGGHKDSAHDLGIYALLLEDYDDNPDNGK